MRRQLTDEERARIIERRDEADATMRDAVRDLDLPTARMSVALRDVLQRKLDRDDALRIELNGQ